MKYNSSNTPLVCMQTNSTCYKNTSQMTIRGILWHSTGANNPNIKRYVQPSENDKNYDNLKNIIGINTAQNDWNHIEMQAGLNAWIGKLADGSIAAVQTMPWDYKPWGCGNGSKGSCNNGWIQFEICEDGLVNGDYFTKVYNEACELTAYLCKLYGINPNSSVQYNGVNIPTILCHQDSYQLGFGSNHIDVYHWFTKYGKTMANVRADVTKLLNNVITKSENNNNTKTSFTTILRKGSSGEEVVLLQQLLIKLGYNVGPDQADGDFGKNTEKAVIKFQEDHHLEADGEVGINTSDALFKAIESTTSSEDEVYRVRKSWADAATQIGAFKNLNSAKAVVDRLGLGYHVYNSKGQEIYPESINIIINDDDPKPAIQYNDVMLGAASKDERGQYRGGQAGDQTGKEVYINHWYNQYWNVVLRPKTDALAEKIASQCEAGCNNNNIGYSQSARNTIYVEAIKVGLDLAKITTPCNCDCSSFVGTVCVCAGLPANAFYVGDNMPVTSNLKQRCLSTNQFLVLTGEKYTRKKDYLKRGDILLNESQHVVIILSNGSNVEQMEVESGAPVGYKIQVTATRLNVRKSPNKNSPVVAQLAKGYYFTIVEEKGGFGKLKSGTGWIDLQYTKKVS